MSLSRAEVGFALQIEEDDVKYDNRKEVLGVAAVDVTT